MKYLFLLLLLFLVFLKSSSAQPLKPGFNKEEYLEMLRINGHHYKELKINIPEAKRFKFVYRSPVCALDNVWSLWTDNQQTAVICIRGTTTKTESWLENFYSAQVPAQGHLILQQGDTFTYKLANDPQAAVHAGWLTAVGFLSKTILPKIDSCYAAGIKNVIISGHSQGGGISYLLTAYLWYLQKAGRLPADIQFKTYCSAAPKPGNLFFAYDYEYTTNGWTFNVVNPVDWVPQTPVEVQTVYDLSPTNPFINAKPAIRKMKIPQRWLAMHVYNRLRKPSLKVLRINKRYLGNYVGKMVEKKLPGFQKPALYNSNNYIRAGATIVLHPDSAYFKKFPEGGSDAFIHHVFQPYYYLAEKLPE